MDDSTSGDSGSSADNSQPSNTMPPRQEFASEPTSAPELPRGYSRSHTDSQPEDSRVSDENPRPQLIDSHPTMPLLNVPKGPRQLQGSQSYVSPRTPAASDQTPDAESDYDNYTKHPDVHVVRKRRPAKIITIMLLVLAIAAAAYWWFVLQGDKTPAPATTSQEAVSTDTANEKPEALISKATKHYTATNFTLEFDYPDDWTVTETAQSGKLTVRSPKVALKNAAGKTENGQIVLQFRDKQQPLNEFDAGNAVAVLASEKIGYAQPSSVQRGSTYVSFLQYASRGTTGAGIDGLYITGDTGYQIAQAIPAADFVAVDPVISITFEGCEGMTCKPEGQSAIRLQPTEWKNELLTKPLLDMLQSLVIM